MSPFSSVAPVCRLISKWKKTHQGNRSLFYFKIILIHGEVGLKDWDIEKTHLRLVVWSLMDGQTDDGPFDHPESDYARKSEKICISKKVCSLIIHLHLNRSQCSRILPHPKQPGKKG